MSKKITFLIITLIIIAITISACNNTKETTNNKQKKEPETKEFYIKSFPNNTYLSSKHTCQGENINPAIEFINPPEGTKTYAITVTDPDANNFVHWAAWNIKRNISEGQEQGTQGTNSFGTTGWKGPCPPTGTHHYIFKAYALNTEINLPEGATIKELEQAMKGKILAETSLTGLYKKK